MFSIASFSSMFSSSAMSIATLFVFDATSAVRVSLVHSLRLSIGPSWSRDKCSTTAQQTQHAQTFVGVVKRSLDEMYKSNKFS